MEKVYIFGHQTPDTDAVTASISLSYLKNQLGMVTEPRVLGHINKETKYALDCFNQKEPAYLNDVKLQLKDIEYLKGTYISKDSSISKVYDYLNEKGLHKFFIIAYSSAIFENTVISLKNVLLKFMPEKDFSIILINQSRKVNEINLKNVYIINQYKNYENFLKINKNGEWVNELEKRKMPESQKIYNEVTSGLIEIISNVMKS